MSPEALLRLCFALLLTGGCVPGVGTAIGPGYGEPSGIGAHSSPVAAGKQNSSDDLSKRHELEQGAAELQRRLDGDPDDVAAALRLAETYQVLGRRGDALRTLETIAARQETSSTVVVALRDLLLKPHEGRPIEHLGFTSASLGDQADDCALAWAFIGFYYEDHSLRDKARDAFGRGFRAAASPRRRAAVHFLRGRAFLHRGDIPSARTDFLEAIRLEPSAPDAWFMEQATREGAVRLDGVPFVPLAPNPKRYEKDPRAGALIACALADTAVAYVKVRRLDEALPRIVAALSLRAPEGLADSAAFYVLRGNITVMFADAMIETGQLDEGLRLLRQLSGTRPQDAVVRWILGMVLLVRNERAKGSAGARDRSEAARALLAAKELGFVPRGPREHIGLGSAYLEEGNLVGAMKELFIAKRAGVDAGERVALVIVHGVGKAALKGEVDKETAAELLPEAARLWPDSGLIRYYVGAWYATQEMYEEALAEILTGRRLGARVQRIDDLVPEMMEKLKGIPGTSRPVGREKSR